MERTLLEWLRDEADEFDREERSLSEILRGTRYLGTRGNLRYYAGGDWNRLSSLGEGPLTWEGHLFGAHLGANVLVSGNVLAGLDVARHVGSVDWSDATGGGTFDGDWRMRLNAVYPYAAWFTRGGVFGRS